MILIADLLENTCKNVIRTILFCLDTATKGTIYRVSPMPKLQAVRVTSGLRVEGSDEIRWGLPSYSDYNYPGKSWEEYKDRPDRVLEAMGWCVEKQVSWTADNPFEDIRSVEKQLRGEIEDFHHMEPVLVSKKDLYGGEIDYLEYPLDWRGNPIWQDTEFVVVAVIKIHFLPNTLRRDDRSTAIIRELSRSLGTELLSLHLRETLSRKQKEFARQRLHSCELLAHELRNTLIRFGFIFSAVNSQIGILREEWEAHLRRAFPDLEWKCLLLARLNELIRSRLPEVNGTADILSVCQMLISEQEELNALPLLASHAEQWLAHKVAPKWERILSESHIWSADAEEIRSLLKRVRASFRLGTDVGLAERLKGMPDDVKHKWSQLSYTYYTADNLHVLREIIELLEHPALPVPHKLQMAKVLRSLKVLIEVVPEVEERANRIILSLRDGSLSDADAARELDGIFSCVTGEYDSTTEQGDALSLSFVD